MIKTDIHSHILNGLDDGSRSVQDSIAMLSELSRLGFTDVICTPHYILGDSFSANNYTKLERARQLQESMQLAKLAINLHVGNEIFMNNKILRLIAADEVHSIKEQYLLVEIPFEHYPENALDIIAELQQAGYRVILAHPERYLYFQKNPNLAKAFKNASVAFQCNYGSIVGVYGPAAEKLVQFYFKNHYVDYLGTDLHRPQSDIVAHYHESVSRIKRLVGEGYYTRIMNNNNHLAK